MSNFFSKLTSVVGGTAIVAVALSSSLVAAASEFLPYAEVLADNDVISAQSSESGYRLGDNITRAELAKVVANLGGYAPTSCAGDIFSDVGSSLGDLCGYIEALAEGGVVSTTNATFRPMANVTRAEMVKMILAAIGEEGSSTDAGYMDVASLGDLAMYINRANEIGCAKSSSYFRPNATSSRGEAFKIASCAAGLEMGTEEPPVDTGTGTTSTGTTSTGTTTVSGALTVSLDGTASAQYVPKNASSVKVGAVKLMAGANDVTVQSLTVVRSGLGNANDIASTNGVRAAQNGVVISSSADYYNPTSQKATVYFSPALVVKAGATQVVDILVNLSGAENSQHQFTLDSVNASNTAVTGAPVTLGLLNTTSYVTTTTTASLSSVGGNVTPGKTAQLVAKVDITSGGRETKVTGFTLTRSGSTDFTKRLSNVKVYKNGVAVGSVSVTAEKLNVSGLTDVLAAGNTQTYELKADVLVDSSSTVLGYKFDSTTDVNALEVATGYATMVTLGTSSMAITFNNVEVTFEKQSTGSLTVAPGTNNVKLFNGKLTSTVPLTVRGITIGAGVLAGTGITGFVNDQLSVKLNGAEIATLTNINLASVKTVSFVVDPSSPAVITIEGSVKNNASATGAYQFNVALSDVRDSSNNTASVGAGSNLTGDKLTVATAEAEVKTATVAAPSTARVFGNASQEIGRFAVTARNEAARVQTVALTNGGTSTLLSIASSSSSIKLYDAVTGTQVSATATIVGQVVTFSSMNDVIGQDQTKNYKVVLDTTSLDANYGQTVVLGSPTVTIVRDSNSTAITPTGSAVLKTYTIGTVPPTVTVTSINDKVFRIKVTNTDSNTGITLVNSKLNVRTTNGGNNGSFSGSGCLRTVGSTDSCGTAGSTTAAQSVPGLALTYVLAPLTNISLLADKNNGTVEFEVYVNSQYTLGAGAKLTVEVESLTYTAGAASSTESYLGVSTATATFTQP